MTEMAYIFPGQGSQYVGMCKDLYNSNSFSRDFFHNADSILGTDLSRIIFEGPEEILKQTKNTQPAIFLHSILLMKLLKKDDAEMAAGHSLGEYSALVTAGAISFENGLRLVRMRGELMQQAGEREKGTMAAVVGLDKKTVETICTEAASAGIVQCANFNSAGQIVISGSVEGVRKAMNLAKEKGAKLVKELVVSGAFHSPLMESARDGLRKALLETKIQNARIPVYANVTGNRVQKGEEIRKLLDEQLTSPVRWEESVRNMILDGAKIFVEIGPGKTLQGLVRRINDKVDVTGIDKLEELQKFNGI